MVRLAKRRWLAVGLIVTLLATAISWTATATSGTGSVNISSGSSLANGEIASVTALSGAFTTSQGAAAVETGIELYQIDLGAARFSDLVSMHVLLLNPWDTGKALNNPNAWIDVAVYYPDATGAVTLSDGTTKVSLDTGEFASARVTRQTGEVLLRPSVANQSRLYILASITTPGGIPPGQQQQITSLKFFVQVRL